MLTVFQCMTLSGWSYVMYRVADGISHATVIYFILLVVFGAYFIMNLFLAVLKTKFAKAQTLLHSRLKRDNRQKKGVFGRLYAYLSNSADSALGSRLLDDRINVHLSDIEARHMDASRRKLAGAAPPVAAQPPQGPPSSVAESNAAMVKLLASVPIADFDVAVRSEPVLERWRLKAQYRLRKAVYHPYFSRFFMSCIVVNSGEPQTNDDAL